MYQWSMKYRFYQKSSNLSPQKFCLLELNSFRKTVLWARAFLESTLFPEEPKPLHSPDLMLPGSYLWQLLKAKCFLWSHTEKSTEPVGSHHMCTAQHYHMVLFQGCLESITISQFEVCLWQDGCHLEHIL